VPQRAWHPFLIVACPQKLRPPDIHKAPRSQRTPAGRRRLRVYEAGWTTEAISVVRTFDAKAAPASAKASARPESGKPQRGYFRVSVAGVVFCSPS